MSLTQRLSNFFLPRHTVSEVFLISILVLTTLPFLISGGFPVWEYEVAVLTVILLVLLLLFTTSTILFFRKNLNTYSLQFIQIVGGFIISIVGVLYVFKVLSTIGFHDLTVFNYFLLFYAFAESARFVLLFVRYGRPKGYVDVGKRIAAMRSAKHIEIHPIWIVSILIISFVVYFKELDNLIIALASSFYIGVFGLDIVTYLTRKKEAILG